MRRVHLPVRALRRALALAAVVWGAEVVMLGCSTTITIEPRPNEGGHDASGADGAAPLDGRPPAESSGDAAPPADVGSSDHFVVDSGSDVATDREVDVATDGSGSMTWELNYSGTWSGMKVGTTFMRTSVSAVGAYTQVCSATTEKANVIAIGADFQATPEPGCYEEGGVPCIYCSMGGCPSGASVYLALSDSGPLTWEGTCGFYTVTLRGM